MSDTDSILDNQDVLEHTTEIVTAFVAHNAINPADVSKLITDTHAALALLQRGGVPEPVAVELAPAVPVKKSITAEHLICLEDGKKFKSLKRHLWTHYNLTPEQYREKWNLPKAYPMTAPNYSAKRSALARANGLGRKPEEPAVEAALDKKSRKKL